MGPFGQVYYDLASSKKTLQELIDTVQWGSGIFIAPGYSFDQYDQINCNKELHFKGNGSLRWLSGITNKAAIRVTAANCTFEEIYIDNVNELQSSNGDRNYGFEVLANNIHIVNTTIRRFQNGIAVRASGEFYYTRIIDNYIYDCIGVGAEDRGDGIVLWGAVGTVRGNTVIAKTGHDCRIGIHAESLPGYIITPGIFDDSIISFIDNKVFGKFRRGMVFEGIKYGIMSNNIVTDSTWWSYAVITGSRYCQINNNLAIWTATSSDTQGSSFSPLRGPFMIYGDVIGCTIENNKAIIFPGARALSYFIMQGTITAQGQPTNNPINCSYRLNEGWRVDETATVTGNGILADTISTEPEFFKNKVSGYNLRGLYLYGADKPKVDWNEFNGIIGVSTLGIETANSTTGITARFNEIKNSTVAAMRLYGHTAGRVIAHDNIAIQGCTGDGIDCFNSTAGGRVAENSLSVNGVALKNIHASISQT